MSVRMNMFNTFRRMNFTKYFYIFMRMCMFTVIMIMIVTMNPIFIKVSII